jgi:transitional endoplasmic reticulum ATPase
MADVYALARLVSADVEGEAFWIAQYPNGLFFYISLEDLEDPTAGQLVLVNQRDNSLFPAPKSMRWGADWRTLGIVRHVTKAEVTAEVGNALRSFPGERTDLRPGDVVVITDEGDIAEKLAQESDFTPDRGETDGRRFEVLHLEDQTASFIGPDILKLVNRFVEGPIIHKREYDAIGVKPPKGVLLVGPPGTGKSMLARSIAKRADAAFFLINGPEIMSRFVGDAELTLRNVFREAESRDRSIIFLDEIDSIAPARKAEEQESAVRLVGMLLTLMDGVTSAKNVLVIGATNRVDSIDSALRRGGRFQAEIDFPLPNLDSRIGILTSLRSTLQVDLTVDTSTAATDSDGWSGADVAEIWQQAGWNAASEGRTSIAQEDLDIAVLQVSRQVEQRVRRSEYSAQDC